MEGNTKLEKLLADVLSQPHDKAQKLAQLAWAAKSTPRPAEGSRCSAPAPPSGGGDDLDDLLNQIGG